MKVAIYIIRFLLALMFIYAGIEKLFLPYDPSIFRANAVGSDPLFFEFYDFLQNSGYLYFVGFFQLLCGVLLVFKRTYILAAIMLVPLILCLLMTHVYFSKNTFYILFDSSMFLLNTILIMGRYKEWYPILFQKNKTLI
ncbi:DoxX-like protein [Aquimarina sp. MAR_2010_214]|uniref:MauE/DoxX family redox-associated membrane protein n=1 Tax=Aquimarina sp. MAR_2010_214 TaxID=1250026 RepID=UPI000C70B764|nr:MauE/DoxX family redox-associated membrane protein [Aquimarina sp. MAR_2010_214]PKV49233.1 DoxX-like protein [Aquimarina sp. MAR_2010_214]